MAVPYLVADWLECISLEEKNKGVCRKSRLQMKMGDVGKPRGAGANARGGAFDG